MEELDSSEFDFYRNDSGYHSRYMISWCLMIDNLEKPPCVLNERDYEQLGLVLLEMAGQERLINII